MTEDGTIVSAEARGHQQRVFAWTKETGMVELPSLGGTFEGVNAANSSGVLTGVSSFKKVKGGIDERAVIWTPTAAGLEALE